MSFMGVREMIRGMIRPVIGTVVILLAGLAMAAAQQQSAVPVKVTRALSMPIYEEVPLTGSVITKRTSRLSPHEAGLILRIHVDRGDAVREGDRLLVLDDELAVIDSERIAAQVKEAEAVLQEAIRLRNNAAELLEDKHIPASDYAAYLAEVDRYAAILERLQHEHARQRRIVSRHVIFAPFDGVITAKFVEQGEWVNPDTALFELAEMQVLRIIVPVPQHFFHRLHIGTEAMVRFDAYSDQVFSTQVERKIPLGSDNARTFPVMIALDNGQGLFAPGMSARVTFRLQSGNNQAVILLPDDAIVRKPDGSGTIWRVDSDAVRARQLQVETGRRYAQKIEIISDELHPGDLVVIRGNERLKDDQAIAIIEEVEFKIN